MWEPQSHRRLRPGRNHLPRLWPGPVPEPNEPWPRMASFHKGGKGRERARWNTNILLHPRQRTLNSHRPGQQRRLRRTTTLRAKNENVSTPQMADPDPITLTLRPNFAPGYGRVGPSTGRATFTS